MNGRRWLAIDADLFGKRFTDDLYQQFGWAGVVTWIAFLCACKRSRTPGRLTFLNEADALAQMGLIGWEIVDNEGKSWGLDDFWTFTGRKKQTKRTLRGREMNVTSTHWERWQDIAWRAREAERKSTSRQQNGRTRRGHNPDTPRTNVRPDSDSDSDTPLPPTGGSEVTSSRKDENPKDLREAIGALRAERGWVDTRGGDSEVIP